MADERLFDSQINREAEAIAIFLEAKASRTSITIREFIQARLALGGDINDIKDQLLDDLENNGRIFSDFRRSIKATARGSINRVRDAGYYTEFGVETRYRWSAIMVKTCPDCMDRHGQVKLWEEWEAEGLPRSGVTVCRENCHCVLVPSNFSRLEPIKREPRK